MSLYFSTALGMASNNTDAYIGKTWALRSEEQNNLGQFRITRVENSAGLPRVVSDFAGSATYLPSGPGGVNATYDNSLRKYIVGTLKLRPNITAGVEYTGITEFAYIQAIDSNQKSLIVARAVNSSDWVTNIEFSSGIEADYDSKMFMHTNASGNANPRALLIGPSSVLYSQQYPTQISDWFSATTYNDGFAKYAYASKNGVTTALGTEGWVRYTTNGIDWQGTIISGAAGTTFTCAAWSGDKTVCLAAGIGGKLASSTDGQTFVLSATLESTTGWGSRRAAAMASDPNSAGVIYVVCADGTIARSTDYGVSWAVGSGVFSVNQRYDGYALDRTPITCWVYDSLLYVSIYGGQVVAGYTLTTPFQDVSQGFNQYYSTFGTANISGNYAPATASPSSVVRAMFSGGLGRVMYMTSSGPFSFQYDLNLMNQLISLGYNNTTAASAYYDETINCAFVGLSNGMFAYKFNPTVASLWTLYTISGAVGQVTAISRLPNGDIVAVEENGYTAVGYYSSGLSWSENSNLQGQLGGQFIRKSATNNSTITLVSGTNKLLFRTVDGIAWNQINLSSFTSSGLSAPNIVYDPRANNGIGEGLFIAFYGDSFYWYISTSLNGFDWLFAGSSISGLSQDIPTGAFSFGSQRVTIGIKGSGSGAISTKPATIGSWGSTPGLNIRNDAFPIPPGNYYPASPASYTSGTVAGTDVGFASGNYGRVWLSFNI